VLAGAVQAKNPHLPYLYLASAGPTWFANELHPSDTIARLFDEGGCALPDVFFFRSRSTSSSISMSRNSLESNTGHNPDIRRIRRPLHALRRATWGVCSGVHLGGLSVKPVLLGRLYPPDSGCQICFCAFGAEKRNFIKFDGFLLGMRPIRPRLTHLSWKSLTARTAPA